ncbi:transporter [bacterium]|nr:transporter [bacterium]
MQQRRIAPFIVFIITLILSSTSLQAQQREPLVTDRPDQTESASIVPAGWLQVEAGVTYEEGTLRYQGRDYANTWTTQLPGFLLRFGINENFELRLGGAVTRDKGTVFDFPQDRSHAEWPDYLYDTLGVEPFSLGMKAALTEENGIIPQSAVLVHVGLPGTGSEYFDMEYLLPEIRLAFAHTLSDVFSLGYNLGVAWAAGHDSHIGYYSLALGAGITESLGAYAEVYGDLPADMPGLHRADAGVTYLLTPDLQLDLSAGMALSEPVTDVPHARMANFAGVGVSWRFPLVPSKP